ncbi:MAG: glycyl-radical enzyme activating protein [Proteobacteria bacterium]|nr:glycyl-radical enzyme activating protein [Pseudomonadota bacterium]
MTGAPPLIVDIKANCLDDGPGIRSVVFFKGCPLSCVWCHNPESIAPRAELSFDPDVCVGSGECVDRCPEGALQIGRPASLDRDRCTACFDCVDACPAGALERVGRPLDVAEIARLLLRDKPFYDHSGGGVTFSGGEATGSMHALGELARTLVEAGVHTLLQTCGAFSRERFERDVYPWLTTIHYDLKAADAAHHRDVCGADNRTILDNFAWVMDRASRGGAEVLPRVPLVPGITDADANLDALAHVLVVNGAPKVQLMAYNPLWGGKALKVGRTPKYTGGWMAPDELRRCADRFERRGLQVVA